MSAKRNSQNGMIHYVAAKFVQITCTNMTALEENVMIHKVPD